MGSEPTVQTFETADLGDGSAAVEALRQDGVVILKGGFGDYATEIRDYIRHALSLYAGEVPSPEDLSDAMIAQAAKDRKSLSHVYEICKNVLPCRAIGCDDRLINIAKRYMDTDHIVIQPHDNILRMDLPNETARLPSEDKTSRLLPWHQDYPYIQGSERSLTVYLSTQDSGEYGALDVALGSHTDGVFESLYYESDHQYHFEVAPHVLEQFPIIPAHLSFGDILIFDMMLAHRSVPNTTGACRYNLQVRISNLLDEEFVTGIKGRTAGLSNLPARHQKRVKVVERYAS